MIPLSHFATADARRLQGVLFDLDDTLLCDGQLPEAAYSALFRLKESSLRLIALTGRPALWGEVIARLWPVEAAITENGALAHKREGRSLRCLDSIPATERVARQTQLKSLVHLIQAEVPDLVPANDVHGRISDFTFDIGEHEQASEESIRRARHLAHEKGARTTRSSVHLHITFDRTDKATGALAYLRHTGTDPTLALSSFAFIGDSENDAPAFAAFRHSVGVKNLNGHFSILPRYLTANPNSDGFCEFSVFICQARRS